MERSNTTCEIMELENPVMAFRLLGFLKYPLESCGYSIDAGIILVTESDRLARQFVKHMGKLEDVVLINGIHYDRPRNYEVGVRLYSKNDDENVITNYLGQNDFLPVLVVGGIVPKFLQEQFYIFKVDNSKFGERQNLYEDVKKFVLSNINYMQKELNLLKTAEIFNSRVISTDFIMLYEVMIAVGWIWKLYVRNKGGKHFVTESQFAKYHDNVQKWINEIERFEGEYRITEAIRTILYEYVRNNTLVFVEGLEISIKEENKINEIVIYDNQYYFFSESLLKKICSPLLDSISFLQLKQEMYEEGILICNDNSKRNYTIKKELYIPEIAKKIRPRFLKISRESLMSDEGLEPMDYALMIQEEFSDEFDLLEREVVEL